MKTTPYFERVVRARHREANREDWIEFVLANAEYSDSSEQPEGRIAIWGFIAELGFHLRVVVESDGETVHNAFIDRNYTRRSRGSSR